MAGKICMVTGATSGMGQVTARALAQQGATVVVVGRSPEKGTTVVDEIKRDTGNISVEFMLADLSSQQAIRQLAQQFLGRYQRLHVLVNNAGALFLRRQESAEGIEMTFALNHLGYFLLTHVLLDTLRASAPSRIINVSSYGHKQGRMRFDDLQGKQRYRGIEAYRQSKLANVLFTYELARRLDGSGVTANAVNPGLVATSFGLNNIPFRNAWVMNALRRLYGLVAISAEQGAETAIYLASSAEVEGVTGRYFQKLQSVPSSGESYDVEAAARLWQVSAEMTGLKGCSDCERG
ncbi:MAG: SDR family oxidoreductase [Chloroflexi bacterium]|nr:SDR family oxidoreductase [Chloroflexota bacterium]